MITCPWCGTSYLEFLPSCRKCGGPLPPEPKEDERQESVPTPPPPPRTISNSYGLKLMMTDGWFIGAAIIGFIGGVFTIVGIVLTVLVITAFVGIPFLLLGLGMFGGGVGVVAWRYGKTQKILEVMRNGFSNEGRIVSVEMNTMVQVNGRNPWTITYEFPSSNGSLQGSVSTLNTPSLRPDQRVCVLYLPQTPEHNVLYPHP